MNDLISRQDLIDKIQNGINATNANDNYSCGMRNGMRWCMSLVDDKEPSFEECQSAQPEIIRCKECKYQNKFFHEDKRRKEGGYYIFGCELADDYSHVCLDDDFCSRAERKTDE